MNDRELLELAAKAVGLELIPYEALPMLDIEGQPCWNPLTDDGDALRLAKVLAMEISFAKREVWFPVNIQACLWQVTRWHGEEYRLAITLAAAEIGRAMP